MTIAQAKKRGIEAGRDRAEGQYTEPSYERLPIVLWKYSRRKNWEKLIAEDISWLGPRYGINEKTPPAAVEAFARAFVSSGLAANKDYIKEFEEGPTRDLAAHIRYLKREGLIDPEDLR